MRTKRVKPCVSYGLWELAVLALLRESPMHPYQMHKLFHERHKDEFLALKRGSLYHAIYRVERVGLIAVLRTGRTGKRPERTTYRITARGRTELVTWLRRMVGAPTMEVFCHCSQLHRRPRNLLIGPGRSNQKSLT